MLAQLRRWFEILRSAYTSWSAILGTIIATVTLCNVVLRTMHASVAEIFEWGLAEYQRTFHPPIDYVLSFFSIHLPPAGKDLLVAYLAAGGVLYRTLSYDSASPLKKHFPKTWRTRIRSLRMWASTVLAAVLWPCFLGGFMSTDRQPTGVSWASASAAKGFVSSGA